MKYFYNAEKDILVGIEEGAVMPFVRLGGEETVLEPVFNTPSPAESTVKRRGRQPGSKNKPKDEPKKERHVASHTKRNTSFEGEAPESRLRNPTNRDLINEFGKSAVDSIVMERLAGVSIQQMIEDRPPNCSHLSDDDVRTIFHNAEK